MKLLVSVVAIIIYYFLISFIELELNIYEWHWISRATFIILSIYSIKEVGNERKS